ncbi:MAG: transcription antitermination factor NusB [Acidobacteriaceae bacterium]
MRRPPRRDDAFRGDARRERRVSIAPAREVAFELLLRVAAGDAHSDELLRLRQVNALTAQDRNLTTTLVMGTLRWQMALDAVLRPLLARPDQEVALPVLTVLRLGAFQLLHLDRVPAHAVLNDSVELVKQTDEYGAAGMVNAVLRKIAAMPKGVGRDAVAAHATWMVERWRRFYGDAVAESICNYDQHASVVALWMEDPFAAQELEIEGVECAPGELLAGAVRVLKGDVTRTVPYGQGRARVQDEGSQLVAELTAAVMPEAVEVLDACAAPGGKTAILAERLTKAKITAMEVRLRRLEAMRRTLKVHAKQVECVEGDATALKDGADYDLILCDAPCSGTGTMGRNPEIRWRVDEAELKRQQARQMEILKGAARAVRRGGRVVYSTCSLEPEENEDVVRTVVAETGLRVVPVGEVMDRMSAAGLFAAGGEAIVRGAVTDGFLRTLPGVQPCDGFFVAVLERV